MCIPHIVDHTKTYSALDFNVSTHIQANVYIFCILQAVSILDGATSEIPVSSKVLNAKAGYIRPHPVLHHVSNLRKFKLFNQKIMIDYDVVTTTHVHFYSTNRL
jgi:hypothetical protein